jgi:hypothetical protein
VNPANPFAGAELVELLRSGVQTTTPVKGTGVSTVGYEGEAAFVLDAAAASAGTTPSMIVKLQTAAVDTDGDYADMGVAAAAVTEVSGTAGLQLIPFDVGASLGYVRAVSTLTGTSTPTFNRAALLAARKKYTD